MTLGAHRFSAYERAACLQTVQLTQPASLSTLCWLAWVPAGQRRQATSLFAVHFFSAMLLVLHVEQRMHGVPGSESLSTWFSGQSSHTCRSTPFLSCVLFAYLPSAHRLHCVLLVFVQFVWRTWLGAHEPHGRHAPRLT